MGYHMATTGSRDTDVDALRKEIETLRKDLSSLTKTMSEAAKHEYEREVDAVSSYAKEAAETVYGTVERHPEMSLLAAFGAGFLVGLVTRR